MVNVVVLPEIAYPIRKTTPDPCLLSAIYARRSAVFFKAHGWNLVIHSEQCHRGVNDAPAALVSPFRLVLPSYDHAGGLKDKDPFLFSP